MANAWFLAGIAVNDVLMSLNLAASLARKGVKVRCS